MRYPKCFRLVHVALPFLFVQGWLWGTQSLLVVVHQQSWDARGAEELGSRVSGMGLRQGPRSKAWETVLGNTHLLK